jgi:general secretion pathway protein A
MYCQHFGFREEPFGVSPDVRFLFPTAQHTEAMASLYYVVSQRRGLAVLIAAPGLGKTSLLVNLAERIAPLARVALFVNPQFESASVMESVLLAMDLAPDPDAVRRNLQLRDFLAGLYHEGKTCVVIIDEAQHLVPSSLEALRMLSNFETQRQKLIQFVLAGQPALADLLRSPDCEQIFQRVSVFARLEPLSPAEVAQYIAHRLEAAGAEHCPFSPAAIQAIAIASGGVPRNVNTLCFEALTLAFAENKKTVDAHCVARVIQDRALDDKPSARPPSTDGRWMVKVMIAPPSWAPARALLSRLFPPSTDGHQQRKLLGRPACETDKLTRETI